ncbi:MAG: DUF2213 domain-containing protein [Desulfobaccales bacterium]
MEYLTVYLETPWTRQGGNFVAPCTLMVEGVHSGSHGPVFHPAHVLKANTPKWEGQPVTVDHPKQDGQYVDVNSSKAIWDKYVVGRVTKPYYDENKKAIRGTIQIPANHARAAEIIKLPGEVSVGIFSDYTETYGQHGGQEYNRCSITHEPNHLAILPDGVGACSKKAGCGLRVNSGVEILGDALAQWINNLRREARNNMENNHEHEAVYPIEVLEAEFLEQQKARKQPEQSEQDHSDEAVFPPEVV